MYRLPITAFTFCNVLKYSKIDCGKSKFIKMFENIFRKHFCVLPMPNCIRYEII